MLQEVDNKDENLRFLDNIELNIKNYTPKYGRRRFSISLLCIGIISQERWVNDENENLYKNVFDL